MQLTAPEHIDRMLDALGGWRVDVPDHEVEKARSKILQEFLRMVEDQPAGRVGRVVERFIRGQVPYQSLTKPPTTAQFGKELEGEGFHGEEEHNWMRAQIQAETATERRLPSPEPRQNYPNLGAEMRKLADSLKTPEDEEKRL